MAEVFGKAGGLQRRNYHVPLADGVHVAPAPADAQPSPEVADNIWHKELLELFLRNQLNLAPVMPMLALLMGMTTLMWVPVGTVMAWLAGALGCHSVQLFLCKYYFARPCSGKDNAD